MRKISLFIAIILYGCGGGSSSSNDLNAPIITPPPPPPTNTVPDCTPTTYANTLYCTSKRQNLDREFYIYVPNNIDTTNSQVPLLFSLHGYTLSLIHI